METKTYKGSCHCQKVRFEVTTDLASVITCNCSMCSRAGTQLNFVPKEQFKLESGEEALSNYHFNKNIVDHFFCKFCGIKPFAQGKGKDGKEMVGINIRCLEDFNNFNITPMMVDGKSL